MLQVRAPQPVRDPGRFLRRRAEHAHVDLAVGPVGMIVGRNVGGVVGGIARADPCPPGPRSGEPRSQPGGGGADHRPGTTVHTEHHEGRIHGVEA